MMRKIKFIVICWVISLIITIGGFLWYLNQFEYSGESASIIETENQGNITTGDIDNG